MVNVVFKDAKRPEFDPEANTDEFIAQIPDYVAKQLAPDLLLSTSGWGTAEFLITSPWPATSF